MPPNRNLLVEAIQEDNICNLPIDRSAKNQLDIENCKDGFENTEIHHMKKYFVSSNDDEEKNKSHIDTEDAEDEINIAKDDSSLKSKKFLLNNRLGLFPSIILLISTTLALFLSILSRQSLDFIKLETPIIFDETFLPVDRLGLFTYAACYNTTVMQFGTSFETSYISTSNENWNGDHEYCDTFYVNTQNTSDHKWEMSRAFNSVATYLGFATIIFFIISFGKEGVNLKTVAIFLLLTYLFESMSFIFFDSEVCQIYGCLISIGCSYAMCSCVLWFGAGLCLMIIYPKKQANTNDDEEEEEEEFPKKDLLHHFEESQNNQQDVERTLEKTESDLSNTTMTTYGTNISECQGGFEVDL